MTDNILIEKTNRQNGVVYLKRKNDPQSSDVAWRWLGQIPFFYYKITGTPKNTNDFFCWDLEKWMSKDEIERWLKLKAFE